MRDRVLVDRRFQILGNELTPAGPDLRDIELGGHAFRNERRQVPVIDQLAHRHLVGDVGKNRFFTFVQPTRIQTVRRCSQADDFEHRIQALEPIQKLAIHRVRGAWNQVRFIDEHQIALLHVVDMLVNRLNTSE